LVDASAAGADATARAAPRAGAGSWPQGGGGLLLVIVMLVAAGLVLLVTGFIENTLILLYLSIGSAALAGVGLIVFTRRNRRWAAQFETDSTEPAPSGGVENG
jgi:UPF0716 family protein affecting phage T7 exclusion